MLVGRKLFDQVLVGRWTEFVRVRKFTCATADDCRWMHAEMADPSALSSVFVGFWTERLFAWPHSPSGDSSGTKTSVRCSSVVHMDVHACVWFDALHWVLWRCGTLLQVQFLGEVDQVLVLERGRIKIADSLANMAARGDWRLFSRTSQFAPQRFRCSYTLGLDAALMSAVTSTAAPTVVNATSPKEPAAEKKSATLEAAMTGPSGSNTNPKVPLLSAQKEKGRVGRTGGERIRVWKLVLTCCV